MKLELKNIKVHKDMSEETTCFSAVLYANGKKVAVCKNDGRGGCTDVYFLEYGSQLTGDVMKYCKENPIVNYHNSEKWELHGVDHYVDDLLYKHLYEKDLKKWQKKKLVLHDPSQGDREYVVHATLTLKMPISELMEHEVTKTFLRHEIEKVRMKGYVVMNTNINSKELGL